MSHSNFHQLRERQLRGLYVITDAVLGGGHENMVRAALAGGAKVLQLRDKTTPLRQLLPIAESLRALTRKHGALLLINDRLDLALACEADGVHLGDDDFPLEVARRVLGAEKIIGVSAATPALARAAEQGGADYLGVGAVFGTQTKLDAGAPIGLAGLRAVVDATSLPVAAIGGMNGANLASTIAAGAAMACVISALGQSFRAAASEAENAAQMAQVARELVALANAELEQRKSERSSAGATFITSESNDSALSERKSALIESGEVAPNAATESAAQSGEERWI